jgi:hypothetical protein
VDRGRDNFNNLYDVFLNLYQPCIIAYVFSSWLHCSSILLNHWSSELKSAWQTCSTEFKPSIPIQYELPTSMLQSLPRKLSSQAFLQSKHSSQHSQKPFIRLYSEKDKFAYSNVIYLITQMNIFNFQSIHLIMWLGICPKPFSNKAFTFDYTAFMHISVTVQLSTPEF